MPSSYLKNAGGGGKSACGGGTARSSPTAAGQTRRRQHKRQEHRGTKMATRAIVASDMRAEVEDSVSRVAVAAKARAVPRAVPEAEAKREAQEVKREAQVDDRQEALRSRALALPAHGAGRQAELMALRKWRGAIEGGLNGLKTELGTRLGTLVQLRGAIRRCAPSAAAEEAAVLAGLELRREQRPEARRTLAAIARLVQPTEETLRAERTTAARVLLAAMGGAVITPEGAVLDICPGR